MWKTPGYALRRKPARISREWTSSRSGAEDFVLVFLICGSPPFGLDEAGADLNGGQKLETRFRPSAYMIWQTS